MTIALTYWHELGATETQIINEDHETGYICHQARRCFWIDSSWWRHQMETFSALLALCAGNSPVSGEFPAQRPVTRSFGVFFDLHLIKRLSKHSRGWWFETLWSPLWCHCYVLGKIHLQTHKKYINIVHSSNKVVFRNTTLEAAPERKGYWLYIELSKETPHTPLTGKI